MALRSHATTAWLVQPPATAGLVDRFHGNASHSASKSRQQPQLRSSHLSPLPLMRASEHLRKRKVTDQDTLTDINPRPASTTTTSSRMSLVTPAPFEPSTSISSSQNRPTMATAVTAPPGDYTLPNIDFGFDDLRDRMAKFSAKFDAFIEQGRKRVLEERNQFRINMAELQGTFNRLF